MVECITDTPSEHKQRVRVIDFSYDDVVQMMRMLCEDKGICAGPAMQYVIHGLTDLGEGIRVVSLEITGDGVDDTRRKYA